MGVDTTVQTNNQLTNNYDFSKIFLFGNKYETGNITNGGGVPLVILGGTLIGRIAIGQELLPCASAAGDGSEFPIGVMAQDVTIAVGETLEVSIGVAGEVAEEKIIFDGADDFDTIVDGRSYRDRIASDTVGILLVASTSLTNFDN